MYPNYSRNGHGRATGWPLLVLLWWDYFGAIRRLIDGAIPPNASQDAASKSTSIFTSPMLPSAWL